MGGVRRGVIDSLCNEQRSATLYIGEEAHYGSFTSNKTRDEGPWRTDAPRSAPKQAVTIVEYSCMLGERGTPAHRGEHGCGYCAHPLTSWINLGDWRRVCFFWTLLTHGNQELQENSLGVKKDLLEGFFSSFFSPRLPQRKYFGIGRFCCSCWLVTRLPWRSEKDGSLVHLYHRLQHHVDITGMKEDNASLSWAKTHRGAT